VSRICLTANTPAVVVSRGVRVHQPWLIDSQAITSPSPNREATAVDMPHMTTAVASWNCQQEAL
jgi:hypothetical protein